MQSQKMKQKICMPLLIAEHDPYRIKFAVTGDETNAALKVALSRLQAGTGTSYIK